MPTRPPAWRTASAASSNPASPRAISPTAHPWRAKSPAVHRPIPEEPPVMNTTRSRSGLFELFKLIDP
jgi:hypothetical protein